MNDLNHNWSTLTVEEILHKLETSTDGLTEKEVANRQAKFGKNLLPKKKAVTLFQVIIRQFMNPLIYVLVGATIVSILLQEIADAVFILIVLLVNALIGTIQEWRAETSAKALQDLVKITAQIIRNGKSIKVEAEELVPGDLVLLESGNKVPADLRLIKTNAIRIEEAILTGESVAIEKHTESLIETDLTLGDQVNMAFAGTIVTTGRATGVVVQTGKNTALGKIAETLKESGVTVAPLVKRMERFSKSISIIILLACLLLGIGGYLAGFELATLFFFIVAIAVSAIPEGLPISMTVALSTGTFRMSQRNVIIRKLTAVEGLGSCTMISTDKTGTLTVDQQTVKHVLLENGTLISVNGQGYNGIGEVTLPDGTEITYEGHPELQHFVETVVVCNEANLEKNANEWTHQGDAVDVALLALAYKSKTSPKEIHTTIEILKEIPFESARKYAAVYYKKDGETYIAIKGAAEVLLEATENTNHPIAKEADNLAEKGFRYIAVASGKVEKILPDDQLPKVNLLGFVALIDPPREEAKTAIDKCHKAGVAVSMITGDHPATAFSIANELHISTQKSEVITGKELANYTMTSPEFDEIIKDKRVFARVSPEQKQAIVAAQQRLGHFVAVTGDGVNDAPALKTANIGVAMGYGTDVAKETASIIITDNNFASIEAGIEEGRFTYANIRKIIYLLISCGAAELLMISLALIVGTPLPFLPAQILWLNLVTNGIQDKVLAFEKGEQALMEVPPRDPKEGIFNRLMIQQTILAAITMAILTFGLWYHLIYNLNYSEESARNICLLLMVLLQNFHVFNARSETKSLFGIPLSNNKWLFVGIIGAQGIHILAMYIPFMQNLLALEPVSIEKWLYLFLTASIILVVMEGFKFLKTKLL